MVRQVKKLALRCLALTMLFYGCREPARNAGLPLTSLAPEKGGRQLFARADSLRNAASFTEAKAAYDSLIALPLPDTSLRQYARVNSRLLQLLSWQPGDVMVQEQMLPKTAPDNASEALLQGWLAIRNGESGVPSLHIARRRLAEMGAQMSFEQLAALEGLGLAFQQVHGETDSSAHYYQQAVQLARSHDRLMSHLPRLLAQIAEVAITNRDYVNALGYTEEGLELEPPAADLGELLILKGTLLRRLEHYDSADIYYEKAERIAMLASDTALLAKTWREYVLSATITGNDSAFNVRISRLEALPDKFSNSGIVSVHRLRGYHLYLQGDFENSIAAYQKALECFSASTLPDIVQVGEAHFALTTLYRELKNFDKAEEAIFLGLTYFTRLRGTSFSWDKVADRELASRQFSFVNYQQLAEVELQRYKAQPGDLQSLTRSFELYKMIDSLMFRSIRVVEEDALLMFLRIGRWVYSGAIQSCYYLYQHTSDTSFLGHAHLFMERGKGLITYQDILARNDDYFSDVPQEFRQRELALKARIAALKRTQAYDSEEMRRLLNESDQYYATMESRYPGYYRAKYELNVASYRYFSEKARQQQTTVVQYFVADSDIFYLTYGAPGNFGKVPADTAFKNALLTVRQELERPPGRKSLASAKKLKTTANYLYNLLIKPLGALENKLLIIPHGNLEYLPFEVLTEDTTGSYRTAPYLVKKHMVSYAPNLQVYELTAGQRTAGFNQVLGYAMTSTNGGLPGLAGTGRDLQAVEQVFQNGSVTLRQNEEATRERLLADLQQPYDLIHIGLHATSSQTNRLENKIQCYDAGDQPEAGVYGYEIAPLPINAHTVVLTACQSAFGPIVQGEGTYSLARAFRQAGVANVIASLWNLSDGTTTALVRNFYHNLGQGGSPSESLSSAKRAYLKQADDITAHPHFWAGLICSGN